jgi:hypothetical protein
MTVLMREDMNDADVAWAAADACVGRVADELLRARHTMGVEREVATSSPNKREVIDPAVLRARGAL